MNHADVSKYLAEYLEGELSLDARARVDAHLDQCETCAQEVIELQQTIRLLRTLPEPETPPMIAANVMRRIRAGETEPSFLGRIGRMLGAILEPGFVLPASAIAAAALVVMVVQDPSFTLASNPPQIFSNASSDASLGAALPLSASATRNGSPSLSQRMPAEPRRRPLSRPLADYYATSRQAAAQAAREASELRTGASPDGAVRITLNGALPGSATVLSRRAGANPQANLSGVTSEASSRNGRILRSPQEIAVTVTQPRSRVPADAMASSGRRPPFYSDLLTSSRFGDGQRRSTGAPVRTGNRNGGALRGSLPSTAFPGSARPVATPARADSGDERRASLDSSGGEDARDQWLARGLQDPIEFARFLASQTLAEQELWVERLAERAQARGLLDELVRILRSSGEPSAVWLADDFAAEAERALDESAGPAKR